MAAVISISKHSTLHRLVQQKISKVNRDNREQLLGVISHELRAPMSSIVLAAEMLENYFEGSGFGSNIAPRESIERIRLYAEKALKLSRDFMELSIYGSGKMRFEPKLVHLSEIIDLVLMSLQQELMLHPKINVIKEDGFQDISGYWDPDRLEQVFNNLIFNAIKYSKPEGGEIIIRASQSRDHVIVSVIDFGIGIPSADLDEIFNPFVRAENIRDLNIPGHGLGLKIAKDIVDYHGGKIWVESTVGVGSQFHVRLPLH